MIVSQKIAKHSKVSQRSVRVLIYCSTILLCLSVSVRAQTLKWQMPLVHDVQNFQTQLAINFSQQVKKATDNRLIISTYPEGSLFKGEQIFGAVRNNLVPIGARLISALDHESIMLQLDALPFLAKNYTEAFNLYKASKGALERLLKAKGVKLLYAVPWPAQGFYSRQEISDLEDFQNKTFRPYNQLTSMFGEKLGLTPIIISLSEVPNALRKKQLDVLFGSPLSADKWQLPKYFSHWYDIQAWLPKEMVVVNINAWNMLSVDDQRAVVAIAKNIEGLGWANSKRESDRAKQYLRNSGVKVETLTFELQRKIEIVGLSLVQQWLTKIGDQGRYLLERYINLSGQPAK